MQDTDPLAHKDPQDPERAHPVDGSLEPMSTLQHSTMVTAGATLLLERMNTRGLDGPSTREFNLGHARRKVELYERMLAEETASPGRTGGRPDELRDLLARARARLAELTTAPSQAQQR